LCECQPVLSPMFWSNGLGSVYAFVLIRLTTFGPAWDACIRPTSINTVNNAFINRLVISVFSSCNTRIPLSPDSGHGRLFFEYAGACRIMDS
jgi:hypothetical protein